MHLRIFIKKNSIIYHCKYDMYFKNNKIGIKLVKIKIQKL